MKIFAVSSYNLIKKNTAIHYPSSYFSSVWSFAGYQEYNPRNAEMFFKQAENNPAVIYNEDIFSAQKENKFYYVMRINTHLYQCSTNTPLNEKQAKSILFAVGEATKKNTNADLTSMVKELEKSQQLTVEPPKTFEEKTEEVKQTLLSTTAQLQENMRLLQIREQELKNLLETTKKIAAETISFSKKVKPTIWDKISNFFSSLFCCRKSRRKTDFRHCNTQHNGSRIR